MDTKRTGPSKDVFFLEPKSTTAFLPSPLVITKVWASRICYWYKWEIDSSILRAGISFCLIACATVYIDPTTLIPLVEET